MIETVFNGVKGVFLSDEELDSLRTKIKANNELIQELINEVGLNDKTI